MSVGLYCCNSASVLQYLQINHLICKRLRDFLVVTSNLCPVWHRFCVIATHYAIHRGCL